MSKFLISFGLLTEINYTIQRLDQLHEKGKSSELIHRLAEDAYKWAKLRNILQDQVYTARKFAVDYSHRYNASEALEDLRESIDGFADDVNHRINQLDQIVRDLLQLVSLLIILFNDLSELILCRSSPGSRLMRPTDHRASQ
jgi:hypothetical protein